MDRESLTAAILAFLAGQDLLTLQEIRGALVEEIDRHGPEALLVLKQRLATEETGWAYYAGNPLVRRIHHVLADRLLQPGSTLTGIEHVEAVARDRVLVFANHLSYADANLIEILLARSGGMALADRLTAIAGPKVYSHQQRRFSSLCFGTVRVPQSSGVSSEDAVMSPRKVAQAARAAIRAAHDRVARGDALVLFGEGTRSRTGGMQPMLAAVTRYLGDAASWVLPMGIVGTDALFPIDGDALQPSAVTVRVGRPMAVSALHDAAGRDRRLTIDAVGLAIAELLPQAYRGWYSQDHEELAAAGRVLAQTRAASARREEIRL